MRYGKPPAAIEPDGQPAGSWGDSWKVLVLDPYARAVVAPILAVQ